MQHRPRRTNGRAMPRLPFATTAGALLAAASWLGCNAIVGIEAPERENATAATDAGSGGAGAGVAPPGCAILEVLPEEALELSMIDDMEDGNVSILKGDDANPRVGAWFTYHDESEGGAQEPDDAAGLVTATTPERGDSKLAVHTSGNDRFAEWGAGIGFHLSNADYDATGYRGITFWARAEEGFSTDLLVAFVDRQTHPGGGICGPAEGQVPCYDHFHTRVTLASEWRHVKVPVECLIQTGYGVFDALAQGGLRDIQLSFSAGQAFDLWIDDVAFYR
ncbi:hypothetical protein WME94_05210 [Sorangium sp. So ce429]